MVAQKLIRTLPPAQLAGLVRAGDPTALMERGDLNADQATKAIAAFNTPEKLAELETVAQNLSAGWASCPLTENGCIRVLTNPRYPTPVGFEVAVEKLTAARASDYHEFWPDDLSIADASHFNATAIQGHQQITDAYLLALAVHRGGRFRHRHRFTGVLKFPCRRGRP